MDTIENHSDSSGVLQKQTGEELFFSAHQNGEHQKEIGGVIWVWALCEDHSANLGNHHKVFSDEEQQNQKIRERIFWDCWDELQEKPLAKLRTVSSIGNRQDCF